MASELYDWVQISKDYVQGISTKNRKNGSIKIKFPTHEELCKKYGCSIITIRRKSQDEKWGIQRSQLKRKLKIKNSEIKLDDLIGEGAKFDGMNLNSLENIQKLIDSYLEPYMMQLDNDAKLEDLRPLSIKELKDVVGIIKDSHHTVRSILGETNNSNLLDDIKEDSIVTKKHKSISKSRLKELSKQLSDAEKLKEELELKREELKKKLNTKEIAGK